MRKAFTAVVSSYPEDRIYHVLVTDREEERDAWKGGYAKKKAAKLYEKETGKTVNTRYIRVNEID